MGGPKKADANPSPAKAAKLAEYLVYGLKSPDIPLRPQTPSRESISNDTACSVRSFIKRLDPYIRAKLSYALKETPGVWLSSPLHRQTSPKIEDKDVAVTGYKEPFDDEHCLIALKKAGLYESSAPMWKLNLTNTEWEGFKYEEPTWLQYSVAGGIFDEAAFVRSSNQESKRRYIFPGFIPTAAKSLAQVKQMLDAGGLEHMPACGGLAVLWALLGAFDEAFELMKTDEVAGKAQVLKLYEVSLSVTIRLRIVDDVDTLLLDNLSFAEVLRCSACASAAESFFTFVQRVAQLSPFNQDATGPKNEEALRRLGIQWKGQVMDKAMTYKVMALAPYTKSLKACNADAKVNQACPTFSADPTRLSRLAQLIHKESANVEDALRMFCYFMDWVRVSVLTNTADMTSKSKTCKERVAVRRPP